MKNKFLFAVIAAAAVMTSCQKDDLDAVGSSQTGELVPFNLSVGIEELEATKSESVYSENSGWNNYTNNRNGILEELDHRLTIQIFEKNGESPVVTSVTAYPTEVDDEISKIMKIEDLRLTAGMDYTVAVWVDFVEEGESADLWYNTANLSKVSMIGLSSNMIDMTSEFSKESRDAYTASMDFTVNTDGTWTPAGEEEDLSSDITLTATRPFSKVRVILTDYQTRSAWDQYLEATSRELNYTALTVKSTPTVFDALSGEGSSLSDVTFHSVWADDNISWVSKNENGAYKSDDEGTYPIIDMSYVFPVTADSENSANAIGVQVLSLASDDEYDFSYIGKGTTSVLDSEDGVTQIISYNGFAAIPVVTNYLTSIIGNFITEGFNFTVTVEDAFTSKDTTVEVEDDGSSLTTIEYMLESGYTVKIFREDAESTAVTYVAVYDPVLSADIETVLAQITAIEGVNQHSEIGLMLANDDVADFSSLEGYLSLTLVTNETANDIELTGLNIKNIIINIPEESTGTVTASGASQGIHVRTYSTANSSSVNTTNISTASLDITNTTGNIFIEGTFDDVTANAAGDVLSSMGANGNAVLAAEGKINAEGTYAGSFVAIAEGDVNVEGTYTLSTGTFATSLGEVGGVTAYVGDFTAMSYNGNVTVTNATVEGTSSLLSATGSVDVIGSTFTSNFATTSDGGVYVAAFNAYGKDVTIDSNSSIASGAIIAAYGEISAAGSFKDLTAITSEPADGSAYIAGSGDISVSGTVSGALTTVAFGDAYVYDVTVTGAALVTAGGQVRISQDASKTAYNSTFASDLTVVAGGYAWINDACGGTIDHTLYTANPAYKVTVGGDLNVTSSSTDAVLFGAAIKATTVTGTTTLTSTATSSQVAYSNLGKLVINDAVGNATNVYISTITETNVTGSGGALTVLGGSGDVNLLGSFSNVNVTTDGQIYVSNATTITGNFVATTSYDNTGTNVNGVKFATSTVVEGDVTITATASQVAINNGSKLLGSVAIDAKSVLVQTDAIIGSSDVATNTYSISGSEYVTIKDATIYSTNGNVDTYYAYVYSDGTITYNNTVFNGVVTTKGDASTASLAVDGCTFNERTISYVNTTVNDTEISSVDGVCFYMGRVNGSALTLAITGSTTGSFYSLDSSNTVTNSSSATATATGFSTGIN